MAFLSGKRKAYLKQASIAIVGLFVFIATPNLAYKLLFWYEIPRPRLIGGAEVYVTPDGFGLISVYVLWVFLTLSAIMLYVTAYIAVNILKNPIRYGDALVALFMACLTLVPLAITVITAVFSGIDLVSKGITIGSGILSLTGLTVSFWAIRKMYGLSRQPGPSSIYREIF